MKIVILKQNLKEALGLVERGIKDDLNFPILKNVLLKADTQLNLITTNLEIGITHQAPAKIIEGGALAVPFIPLFNIINSADSERIQLIEEKGALMVKTDNYDAKIQGLPSNDYPIIPSVKNTEENIKIKTSVWLEAVEQIISAAHISELKPELSGILFDFQVGVLKLVATDSFRLAEKTILSNSFSTNLKKGVRAIIPLSTIQESVKAAGTEEEILFCFDSNQVSIQTSKTTIISRLIDGEYPDYQPIIPKEINCEVILEKEKLLTAVKLASTFSGKTSDVRLRVEKDKKVLEVYSVYQSLGENTYLIPIKKQKGEGFEPVSFNWRYILDGVRPIQTKQISLGVVNDAKPATLRPFEDDSLLYIVMPTKNS